MSEFDSWQQLDDEDPLKCYREKFHIPKFQAIDSDGSSNNGKSDQRKEMVYFCGNSLGLQPKSARKYIEQGLHYIIK